MKTLILCARKDHKFVLGDHKLVVFEKTGLVVYDDIQVRRNREWIETSWHTKHHITGNRSLVLRIPSASTRKWQVDAN